MSSTQNDLLMKLYNRMRCAVKYKEVIDISRSIYYMNISKDNVDSEFMEIGKKIIQLLEKFFVGTTVISNHKVMINTIFKLSIMCNVDQLQDLLDNYQKDYGLIGSKSMEFYAKTQNYKFIDNLLCHQNDFYELVLQGSLKYSKDTKFFSLAIENHIQAYDLRLVQQNHPFLLTLICTNLENSHKGVHKLLLELFQRYLSISNDQDCKEMMNLIMNNMSWFNRSKHYLLIQLITTRPDFILNYEFFNVSDFVNGLRCGLSQYHLYSSSLSVIKVIYDKSPFREQLLITALNIILYGSIYEIKNFFKFWFTVFDDKLKEELYNLLIKNSWDFRKIHSTSPEYYRSSIISSAFNRSLKMEIESSIKKNCFLIDDVNIKLELFNILLSDVYNSKDTNLEAIMRILKFIHFNMCITDSQFIDDVMRKLPPLFSHLATNRFRHPDVSREIFKIIRDDIFLHGIQYGSYESRVFSIKMLQIMFKQYYCASSKGKRSMIKGTDQGFINYLSDNKIWDMCSLETFNYLVDMSQDVDNSDICKIANEIIIDYFIKTLKIDEKISSFLEWIYCKTNEIFNITDVESYHENICYCKMKIEYLIAKNPDESIKELELLINNLETRHDELKTLNDPVCAMENGKNQFILIDAVNYALSRVDVNLLTRNIVLKVSSAAKEIAQQFLDYVNDDKTSPSFDLLDYNLNKLVETSKMRNNNLAETKHKLLLSFFFTTRALSELSVTLATIINITIPQHDDDYFKGMTICTGINIQILTRFCHKGVIEAASQCLGSITKILSFEYLQECDRSGKGASNLFLLLKILEPEIDCGKRHSSKTGEIRGSRGVILMSHLIIKNHPPFLRKLMEQLVDIQAFPDTQKVQFLQTIQPIQLHLLAIVVKDSELAEEMLPYYDFVLMCTFRAYKESKDFIMQNALLQIIGNITTKISNHKRHTIEVSDKPQYESKAISVYEHYMKFTYSYGVALFDLENHHDDLSQTYIIILLEILSNFEFREPDDDLAEIYRMTKVYKSLIDHPCEKIRILAARCYAQWHLPSKLHKIINDEISFIFHKNPNFAHGSIVAVQYMIQRYESSIKFVREFNKESFLKLLRNEVLKSYSKIPTNFYLRYHLFEFLIFLGFTNVDDLLQELMNEENVHSGVGYQLWRKRMSEYNRQL